MDDPTYIAVKYIGRKAIYTENLTGARYSFTKNVPIEIPPEHAKLLLKHSDVFASASDYDYVKSTRNGDGGIVIYGPNGKPIGYNATLNCPNSAFGTSARVDFGSITIPREVCIPGAHIKGWAVFTGSKKAASPPTFTHIVQVNEAGGGFYGGTDIFNAGLATANYGGARIEFYVRILSDDAVEAGMYASSSGIGAVSNSTANNPIVVSVNMRGGGMDIAFGGNMSPASYTGTVDISQAAPGLVAWVAHGATANQPIKFSSPPAPLVADQIYFVAPGSTLLTDSFAVTDQKNGAPITTTASVVGTTATVYHVFGLADAHVEVSL